MAKVNQISFVVSREVYEFVYMMARIEGVSVSRYVRRLVERAYEEVGGEVKE